MTSIRITRIVAPREIAEQVEPSMRRLGNAIGRRAQRLVPKRSWRLHDTIEATTETTGDKIVTRVSMGGRTVRGKTVDYGLHVERGTSRAMAQPFMRPALYQSKTADLAFTGDLDKPHGGA